MTENEVPWSRGRRETRKRKGDGAFCVLIQPDERTTGEKSNDMERFLLMIALIELTIYMRKMNNAVNASRIICVIQALNYAV